MWSQYLLRGDCGNTLEVVCVEDTWQTRVLLKECVVPVLSYCKCVVRVECLCCVRIVFSFVYALYGCCPRLACCTTEAYSVFIGDAGRLTLGTAVTCCVLCFFYGGR
eukprot:GHVQ01018297.1.p2 GENE.GHVQ01018297.1~~GHVQ01018297.1.p2  ORF type:complete len:107 (+),score=4.16 GHVQ01018297.1:201-521(+)